MSKLKGEAHSCAVLKSLSIPARGSRLRRDSDRTSRENTGAIPRVDAAVPRDRPVEPAIASEHGTGGEADLLRPDNRSVEDEFATLDDRVAGVGVGTFQRQGGSPRLRQPAGPGDPVGERRSDIRGDRLNAAGEDIVGPVEDERPVR